MAFFIILLWFWDGQPKKLIIDLSSLDKDNAPYEQAEHAYCVFFWQVHLMGCGDVSCLGEAMASSLVYDDSG